MHSLLIKRNAAHAAAITADEVAAELVLRSVAALRGPAPDCANLIGAPFPDQASLERAVLSRMKDAAAGVPVGSNLIDRVVLSREAVEMWGRCSLQAAQTLLDAGLINSDEIGDEQAYLASGGRLVIFAEARGAVVAEMAVDPGHWAWAEGSAPQ